MKLLKVVFVILILVTFAELSYYLYILKIESSGKLANSQPVSSRELESNLLQAQSTFSTQRPENALLSEDNLLYLSQLVKNPFQKLLLRTETDGYVGGIDEINDKKFRILKIVDSEGKKIINYVLNKKRGDDRHFYLVVGDKKTEISIEDLKVNDKISVIDEHEVRENIILVDFYIYR